MKIMLDGMTCLSLNPVSVRARGPIRGLVLRRRREMAHPDKIPSPHVDRVVEAIREITKQLSGLATNEEELHADNIEPAAIRVNDGLTIWKFKPGSFERLSRDELKDDLFDWVQPTNMVYHPMWLSESPVGFARSTTDLSAKPILQINLSPTSRRAI